MLVEIIHSARPADAPRIGLEIARWLKGNSEDVLLICQEDGPIVRAAREGGLRTLVAGEPLSKSSFRERVAACRSTLEELDCTVVYVNSIAASAWAAAAKMLGAKVVLHAHELDRELRQLLQAGITCLDIGASADAVVVAADAVAKALGRTLGYLPFDVIDIGVFADPDEVRRKALQTVSPQWLFGRPFIPIAT